MGYKYTRNLPVAVGFTVQAKRPLDGKEIVEKQQDLLTLEGCYAGMYVKVEELNHTQFRWTGIDSTNMDNWIKVTSNAEFIVNIEGSAPLDDILGIQDPKEGDIWVSEDNGFDSFGNEVLEGDGLIFNGSGWFNIGALRGPQGEQGEQGPAGPSGESSGQVRVDATTNLLYLYEIITAGTGITKAKNGDNLVISVDGTVMLKTTYDTNGSGVVDDSEKLGGHSEFYFATQTDMTAVEGRVGANETDILALEEDVQANTDDITALDTRVGDNETDISAINLEQTTQNEAIADLEDTRIKTIVPGTNVFVDDTDPLNPVVSSTGGTSAGVVDRAYFTADLETTSAGTFLQAVREGRGVNSYTEQEVLITDGETLFFGTDFLGGAYPEGAEINIGAYKVILIADVETTDALYNFKLELYKTDADGLPIASGIIGQPVGNLGVQIITEFASANVQLIAGTSNAVELTSSINEEYHLDPNQRHRFHISVEKISVDGNTENVKLMSGAIIDSYIEIPLLITSDTIVNVSQVTGATQSDVNNALKSKDETQDTTIGNNTSDITALATVVDGKLDDVIGGAGIEVDKTNPNIPVISATPQSTAGIFRFVYFTGEEETTPEGTFYIGTPLDQGTVATATQSLDVDDGEKLFYGQDILTPLVVDGAIIEAGDYTAEVAIQLQGTAGSRFAFTIEVYNADADGVVIDSGILSEPVGDLGVRPVAVLRSGSSDLPSNDEVDRTLVGSVREQFTQPDNTRGRYHISVEKVDTQGGVETVELYFGNMHSGFVSIPIPMTTDTVRNESNVVGATASDALNSNKANLELRTKPLGNYTLGQEYFPFEQVLDSGYLAYALVQTTDRPSPQKLGDPFYIYDGILTSQQVVAKQVLVGSRYIAVEAVYLSRFALNTVEGEHYVVYSVKDPLGTPVASELLSFTATATGRTSLAIDEVLVSAGSTFDIVALITEPDLSPTEWTGNWTYSTPNNDNTPGVGIANHSNKNLGTLKINKTDFGGSDRSAELGALLLGDTINAAGQTWVIQSNILNGNVFEFGVSPAIQGVDAADTTFTFGTVTATPITYDRDVDYYSGNANVRGLYGADVAYSSLVPDDNAYGIDIEIQNVSVSDDWFIQSTPGGTAGGGDVDTSKFVDVISDQTVGGVKTFAEVVHELQGSRAGAIGGNYIDVKPDGIDVYNASGGHLQMTFGLSNSLRAVNWPDVAGEVALTTTVVNLTDAQNVAGAKTFTTEVQSPDFVLIDPVISLTQATITSQAQEIAALKAEIAAIKNYINLS